MNNEILNEILKIIFGDFTLIELFGYLWFFIIGYILSGLIDITGRDIESPKTPRKWSWKFWYYDNWRRYLTTILCTYVYFRFYNEISGHSFENIDALILGILGDNTAILIKKRVKLFVVNRKNLTLEIKKELGEA